ncbi:hypothetical protein LAZ67_8003827 [Cordylochernes scorpioides]|uniref:Transposase n=1 Tax=Cordylochernes scorpioides TaxID=51811 RepID=A0ABY6KTH6_9ARAC|nr:hypothetical protein LAZ67_8003827 [Cordylochernes scorpioides]
MDHTKKRLPTSNLGRRARCRLWWGRTCAFLFKHVGMFALVVGYSVAGAFAFRSLETRHQDEHGHVATLRMEAVNRMWNTTSALNVLFEDEWSRKVTQEITNFQRDVVKAIKEGYDGRSTREDWSFSSAFLFSITVISTIVTGDESWMFEYDPESKRQSCAWHTKSSPRPKKARMSKSRIKTMIIDFFDIRGIVHCEFVPQGQTVNSAFYLEVLRRLKRRMALVRTDIKDTVKLHHDNATSHTAFIITNFLARSNTSMIPHPLTVPT